MGTNVAQAHRSTWNLAMFLLHLVKVLTVLPLRPRNLLPSIPLPLLPLVLDPLNLTRVRSRHELLRLRWRRAREKLGRKAVRPLLHGLKTSGEFEDVGSQGEGLHFRVLDDRFIGPPTCFGSTTFDAGQTWDLWKKRVSSRGKKRGESCGGLAFRSHCRARSYVSTSVNVKRVTERLTLIFLRCRNRTKTEEKD
jgi:hypothetical protein